MQFVEIIQTCLAHRKRPLDATLCHKSVLQPPFNFCSTTFEAHYISVGTISYSLAGCLLVIKAQHILGALLNAPPRVTLEFLSKYNSFVCFVFRFTLLRRETQTRMAKISGKCLHNAHIQYTIQHWRDVATYTSKRFWQVEPADSLISSLSLATPREVLCQHFTIYF